MILHGYGSNRQLIIYLQRYASSGGGGNGSIRKIHREKIRQNCESHCLRRAAMISGIRQPWLPLTLLLIQLLTMLLSQSETHLSHHEERKEEFQEFILIGLSGYSIYSVKC